MDNEVKRLLDRTDACQQSILRALIGHEVPTIMAALTTITGAMIAQQARTPAEAKMLARQVARGISMVAEDNAGMMGKGH